MFMRLNSYRLKWSLSVIGWALILASCSLVEKRLDQPQDSSLIPSHTTPVKSTRHTGTPEKTSPSPKPADPLSVTLSEAILLCLENNRSLAVEKIQPEILQTFEDQEKAVFDPSINAELSGGRLKAERLARSGSETESFTRETTEGAISFKQYFPSGAMLTLEADTEMNDSTLYSDTFYSNRLGMTISQALLRGHSIDANLATLQQARLDVRMSEYELRGFTESLVAEVEYAYWDYALARRQIEIVEQSIKVVRQQLEETNELITVGRLAKAELAAVQAEVATQEQALIEARAKEEAIRLQLLRLLNPPGPGLWHRKINLVHQPTLPDIKLEPIEQHVAVSLRMRPLLNEARLKIEHGDLELVKTRNGLLPLLDLFITLGKSGYANSFGKGVGNLDEDTYDVTAGVKFELPLINRHAQAEHQRALQTRAQAQEALENLSQVVEVDVRTAYIDVKRTKQQIAASSITRQFNEEKYRTESEKLRVGKSTSFLVAASQRDLLGSRIAEVQALGNYLKALTRLYLQDGSLLVRRGIIAPGGDTVKPYRY